MVCRSWLLAAFAGVVAVGVGVGCVEVPDTVRAEFAGPGPNDRTNYRPGHHGAEPPPVAPPPVAKAATTTTAADAADASQASDAGAAPTEVDGGAP